MILDNQNENLKVYEQLARYTGQGNMDIVTGYFTVGAMAWAARQFLPQTAQVRMILGDIVNTGSPDDRPLDLLSGDIAVTSALRLSHDAKIAVDFLRQDKVVLKTLEPNFCHAKAYIFESHKDEDLHFCLMGSSNLTEAGLGMKTSGNVELNYYHKDRLHVKAFQDWFEKLWNKPQAHLEKTIYPENGKPFKKPFKEYLIGEIEKLFQTYTPRDLYYKVLFELFGHQLADPAGAPDFNRHFGRLERTVIWNSLYEFQKAAVLSLIQMLQKFDGAILADAVGLGKTWTALAVMKYFQMQGREVILLCPKKLEHNWRQYHRKQDSRFEPDGLEYFIRFHTDLHSERLEGYSDRADKFFTNEKPKLLIIDESHNLRNDKTSRYRFLLDELLKKNEDIKVLMLSATPINNSLQDIRNQFKIITKGDPAGFDAALGIRNLDYTFRQAQQEFVKWVKLPKPRISEFIKAIPPGFFRLTDALTVARTRQLIAGQQEGLVFPRKNPPENLFVTPASIGNFESFEELFDHFPPMLSGYQPSLYLGFGEEKTVVFGDEQERERFLVKMMYILMVKRLESSWFSFFKTIKKIQAHHQNALNRILAYQEVKREMLAQANDQLSLFEDDDELTASLEEFALGKKSPVRLKDIEDAGNLDAFKKDLKTDLEQLDLLVSNLEKFERKMEGEPKGTSNNQSPDDKLEALIHRISEKQQRSNPKVLIFTVYRDTAEYLYDQLTARSIPRVAMVSGDAARSYDLPDYTKRFEPILERFAPFTKLYREKEWPGFKASGDDLSQSEKFAEWKIWAIAHHEGARKKLESPVDVLIATDVLSEGQNLQDCDLVINYDIHWNPVRVVQRMGRIDRLGSPNEVVYGINFWPTDNINSYLDLQNRIEGRMAMMKLAGSELPEKFTKSLAEKTEGSELETMQMERMLRQMQVSWDDIEVSDEQFGFDDLSFERYRQELQAELRGKERHYRNMPKGIYTGFLRTGPSCPQPGMIALLGYPSGKPGATDHQYQSFDLVYLDAKGAPVFLNQKEALDGLTAHREAARYVPEEIDRGEPKALENQSRIILNWLKDQIEQAGEGDAPQMGTGTIGLLNKIKQGDKNAIREIKKAGPVEEKYKPENVDLICWFVVS